jgi:energy-coupling factor transport system substrate-specific component
MRSSAIRGIGVATANVVGVLAFAWPLLLPSVARDVDGHGVDYPFILGGLLLCVGTLLFVQLGRGGMGPKTVALIGVLGALMVALRVPGFIQGFSASFIVVLVGGAAFGPTFGFMLGAVGMFASGLFVGGIGVWLPFQMVAVGWIGMGAGLVPRYKDWTVRIACLAAYGFVAGLAYGIIINLYFWPFAAQGTGLSWVPNEGLFANVRHYAAFYLATSLPHDIFRAVGNAVLVIAVGKPLLAALDRAAIRMNFYRVPSRTMEAGPERATSSREPRRIMEVGAGRATAARGDRVEESPDSTGQDAGENPRRGDPRTVQQKADRPASVG